MIHTAKTESVNLFKIKINTQYASYATKKISVKNATLTLDIFCLRHDILTATQINSRLFFYVTAVCRAHILSLRKKVLRNSHYQNELKAPQGRLDVTLNLNFIARVNCLHFLNIVFRSHITHIFFSFWRFVTIGYFSHHTICSTRATTERN